MVIPIRHIILIFMVTTSFAFRCGVNNMKKKTIGNLSPKAAPGRALSTTDYKPLRVFIDPTHINTQKGSTAPGYVVNVLKVLDSTAKMFSDLIMVQRLNKLIISPDSLGNICDIPKAQIDSRILNSGLDADVVIFPHLDPDMGEAEASAYFCALDQYNRNRPIAGVVNINYHYDFNKKNSDKYLQMLMLHELTHVLVFHDELFKFFPESSKPVTISKKVNGVMRTLIQTPKVLKIAREYYGCPTLAGVEVEDQGGEGTAGSHWEARTMLGDYMIGVNYAEAVISEITLGLFEDSGWYKVNYYTGGLFRHGKGKGCSFVEEKCINDNTVLSENEFCNEGSQPRCFSGRGSKGVCYLSSKYPYGSIPYQYQYYSKSTKGGYYVADYCPVAYASSSSEDFETHYYYSNCNYGVESSNPLEVIGEGTSCIISTLYTDEVNQGEALCMPTDCGSYTVSITVGEQVVECPREGGVVSVPGYKGKIYCPDYNLVCTSDKFCNEPISCVSMKAVPKETTFKYDYSPKDSQLKPLSSSYISLSKFVIFVMLTLYI